MLVLYLVHVNKGVPVNNSILRSENIWFSHCKMEVRYKSPFDVLHALKSAWFGTVSFKASLMQLGNINGDMYMYGAHQGGESN